MHQIPLILFLTSLEDLSFSKLFPALVGALFILSITFPKFTNCSLYL